MDGQYELSDCTLKQDILITYRDCHQLADVLDLVASRRGAQSFKLRLNLCLRKKTLLRSLFHLVFIVRAANHNLIICIIFIEKSGFVVNGTRRNFHLKGMLLFRLLDLLQMFINAILSKPGDDIPVGPVDL